MIQYDPQYDAPVVIAQHDRASGALLRETRFGGWFRDKGQALASTVETRTFLPDGTPVMAKTYHLDSAEPGPSSAESDSPEPESNLMLIEPEPDGPQGQAP